MLAVQDSMPFRLSSVHFLNAPSFITNIVNILYPLLKEKLIQKVNQKFIQSHDKVQFKKWT